MLVIQGGHSIPGRRSIMFWECLSDHQPWRVAITPVLQAREGQDREEASKEGQREKESLSRESCGSC